MKKLFHSILFSICSLLPALPAAAGQGYLGISISVDGESFSFNPTLKSIRVAKVAPDSPAQKAGVSEGDLILEIEGKRVAGAKANELKPFMTRDAGQSVRFLLKKASGDEKLVTVIAEPKK